MRIVHEQGSLFRLEQRGHVVPVDQPVSEGATIQGMTPVELLGGALGSCVAVYAADYMQRNGIALEGLAVEVDWRRADKPKRLSHFDVQVKIPVPLTQRQRKSLERIVKACTIHSTLEHAPTIKIELEIAE